LSDSEERTDIPTIEAVEAVIDDAVDSTIDALGKAWILPTDHFSPSQLGTYLRCPFQYYMRYVKHDRRPPKLSWLKGSGPHKGSELRNRQRMEADTEMPRGDVIDASVAHYDHRLEKEGVELSRQEKAEGEKNVIGSTRDTVASMAGCFSDVIAPKIMKPIAVEQKISFPIAKTGIDFLGILDLAHIETGPGLVDRAERLVLEDLKTGKKARSQGDVDADDQLTWYAMGWRQLHGELPDAVGIRQIKELKKGPTPHWTESTRNADDVRRLLRIIGSVGRSITLGIFPPCSTMGWWCSEDQCGWYNVCPFRGRG
jgi:hypothetical protein